MLNQAFTGAANPLDMTGGRFTAVFASKVPDHHGLVLSSAVSVEIDDEDLVVARTGTGLSVWDVASGARMGFVTGEDATEVANSPTDCTSNCQAQNQVRGRLTVLGHPFPVPAGSRLVPKTAEVPAS